MCHAGTDAQKDQAAGALTSRAAQKQYAAAALQSLAVNADNAAAIARAGWQT